MNFIDAITSCFKKYVEFTGRSSRSEYWQFTLFYTVLTFIAEIVDATIAGVSFWEYDELDGPAFLILTVLMILPSISVGVRRLHDINKSGYWLLISITIIGVVPLIYWAVQQSDVGSNRFGPDPLEKENPNRVSEPPPKWILFVLTPLLVFLTMALGLFIAYIGGMLVANTVISGSELSQQYIDELVENDVIQNNDEILYIYSSGLFSMEEGSILTKDHLIIFEAKDNGKLDSWERPLSEVGSVELDKAGNDWGFSAYKVLFKGDDEYFVLSLPEDTSGTQKFIEALRSQIVRKN